MVSHSRLANLIVPVNEHVFPYQHGKFLKSDVIRWRRKYYFVDACNGHLQTVHFIKFLSLSL